MNDLKLHKLMAHTARDGERKREEIRFKRNFQPITG